MLKASVAWQI